MRYKYVSVKLEHAYFFRLSQHRGIIDKYADMGYRYIGYIPTLITDTGAISEIDLIFEMVDTGE